MSDETGPALALPPAIGAARTGALQRKPSFRDTDRFLSVVRADSSGRDLRPKPRFPGVAPNLQEPLNTCLILGVAECPCVTLWGGKASSGVPGTREIPPDRRVSCSDGGRRHR